MPRKQFWGGALADALIPKDDLIRPFQIDPFALRGRHVRLGSVIDRVVSRHGYPEKVAAMLGEAMALAALLAGTLKYEGIFTLQTKGDGPIRLMVADVTSAGAVRGYAQFDAAALDRVSVPGNSVPRLLGAGFLAFTVDQGEHTDIYQGIVDLQGATLADCAHHYFRQSEQIEAGIRVAARCDDAGRWRAGAVMIQRLPDEGGFVNESEAAAEARDDGWRRALMLLGTCRDAELTDPAVDPDALLFRLFHEEGVRVFPVQKLEARCRCSRERLEDVLRALSEEELTDMVEDGMVEVKCEFCSTHYRFSDVEIAEIAKTAALHEED
jgi:molecular chaperone Hsp33